MTQALCFNCGKIKFGALCPCPECSAESTGDIGLDIAFSDHHMSQQTLEDFGKVVSAIHAVCQDNQLCFWAFIHYVSSNHPNILTVNLQPEMLARVEELVTNLKLPAVTVQPGRLRPPEPESGTA